MARNFLIDSARYFAYSSALAAETRPCQTRAMAGPDAPASEWGIAKSAARLRAAMAMRMTASYRSVISMAKRPSASPAPARIPAGCGCRYWVGQPSPYGVAAPCGSTSGRCCQGCGANRRALAVMLGEIAGDADRADELAIDEERQASFDGYCAFERENADADAAFLEHVLERLRRPLVERGGSGLADGDVRAAVLGRVRLLEVDEGAGRIDDRDRHEPFVLACFRRDSRRDFLRVIQADARPDGNGVGAGRRSSLGEGRGGADGGRHDEADGDRSLQHGRPPCEMRHTARIANRAQGASAGGNKWKTRAGYK